MPSGERLILELDPAGGPALRVEWDVDALREPGGFEGMAFVVELANPHDQSVPDREHFIVD